MQDLSVEISNFNETVKSLLKEIKTYIEEHPIPRLPDFNTISTRKGLYESYANVVEIGNKISEYLTKVVNCSVLKISYKRAVKLGKFPHTIAAVYLNSIDEVVELVDVCDKMLNTYKVAVDNQLRLYSSVQYILGSPRLSSID